MSCCAFCGADSPRIKRAQLADGRMRCLAMSGCVKRMRERVGVRVVLIGQDKKQETRNKKHELQAARYRTDTCVDCGKRRHSAGRPRCDGCHASYIEFRALGFAESVQVKAV